ncbi:MAG: alpha-hydroxy-acid oxidizing protein [Nitrospirae bacterium]|nr:alpha-hydroxy-acid oxidizing protein [Nitrospirota bacterium]
MNLAELRENAREKLKGYCRVCPVCNGRVCAGEVPGMGGAGTGRSFVANVEALAACRFNMRTIHEVKAVDTSMDLWGKKLSVPVLAAPITGTTYNMGGKITEGEFIEAIISGSLLAGTLGMTGDAADPALWDSGMKAISSNRDRAIAIIKPREQKEIISRMRDAEKAGAAAVGMDIDGAGLVTMALKGQPVSPKTVREIKEVVSATKLPFILKGIMTSIEAELAVEAGAAAIVVSNHGGRVLDHTPGTAAVLPGIADRVKGKLIILVDGGVRSGADVLKLLALGADAVLVGRPLIVGAFGGGAEGVALLINKMKDELVQAMLLTGTPDVKCVKKEILYSA